MEIRKGILKDMDERRRRRKTLGSMKILIADDSPILRERLKTMLSDFPEVEIAGQAHDTPEAIKSIKELKPDVVILDIRMPGGSGIEVLQSIKKDRPEIKVIMFTNYPYPQYRKKCMNLGADFFFAKATESEEVPKVIEQLLKNAKN
jgi:DNA-binding NarL/FixJ family response regulator